jgi:hypothetical protein
MDRSEAISKKYLESLGFENVIFEPDGNVPPDFLCDSKIAVEVRRLNQHQQLANGKILSLDETSIPFVQRLQNELKTFGPPTSEFSWFVIFHFKRPLANWKNIQPQISEHLKVFQSSASQVNCTLTVSPNFEIVLVKASNVVENQYFAFGGFSDRDSGGWVISEIEKNLKIVIEEKTKKISKFRHKYSEWWLVLPDHIGYGLNEFDRNSFTEQVKIESFWDKIILLDPRDGVRAYEI